VQSWILKAPVLLVFAGLFIEAYCWIAVPNIQIGPSFKQPDVQLGMVQRTDFEGRRYTHEYDMRWSTGTQGFRGGSYSHATPDDGPRIASLGNSHTFGVGVQDNETYSALTARHLGTAEVINMAVTDGGTGILLRTWDEILSYQPDALVIRYDAWNFQDPFKQYLAGDGALEPRNHRRQKASPLRVLESTPLQYSGAWGLLRLRYSALSQGLRRAKCRFTTVRTVHSTQCVPRSDDAARERRAEQERRLLEALALRVAEAGVPVVFLRFLLTERQAALFEGIIPPLDNVRILDFTDTVGNPAYHFPVDKHLNAGGHAFVADNLARELQKLLPEAGGDSR
jgi:hypothetical protein